jgi:hypothetical protein
MNAQVAEALLQQGSNLLDIVGKLEKQYSPEEVEGVLNILQGKKKAQPTRTYSKTVEAYKPPVNPTNGGK